MLLFFVGKSMAQDFRQKFTLTQCLEFAIDNSYTMHKTRYNEDEAKAKMQEIKGAVLPQVNASASLTDNLAIPVVMIPGEILDQPGKIIPAEMGAQYESGVSAQLSQVIFNPALFTGIKVGRNAEELAHLKSQMTKEQLIYDVSSVFYDILHSEQQLASIVSNLKLQDSLYEKTALRVKEDLTREIDLNRIKVNITGLKVRQENLYTVIEQQKKYLQVLIGMPLDEILTLDDSLLKQLDFPYEYRDEAAVLSDKTELSLLNQQKTLNQLELKATKMQYAPTLSVVASAAYQFQSEEFQFANKDSWFNSAFIGLRLSIPIYDGSSKHHQIRQHKIRIQKLDEDINQTKQTIRMNCENAKQDLAVSYQSVRMQEDNLHLAEKVYEQSRLLYQEGLYNVTDLLQTETSLREAQIAYVFEVIRFKKAGLNLMKADGTLPNLLN